VPQEIVVAEPLAVAAAGPEGGVSPASPRFRIFIVDPGWDSPAHRVLQANFGLIRDLQRDDPIYVLGRDKSIEFLRHHQERIGWEPIIAVHDMAALRFLTTHRQSVDLEAEIRKNLRREGLSGAIKIVLHHEPREIGA